MFLAFPSRRLSVAFDIQIDLKMKFPLNANLEAYSESFQTCKMKVSAEIVNSF